MYYFAMLLLIIFIVTWRRDLKAAKRMYINMLNELKVERMELDKLKSHYSELLNKPQNEDL